MKNNRGFTLIELMVVVLIIGILASMGVPYYYKTVETTKATDSVAIGHMLGNAYRMFLIDNPGASLVPGDITNTCNSGGCSSTDFSGCRLVRCNYVAKQDWGTGRGGPSSYLYFVGPAACGGGMACTVRNGGSSPYSGWGYTFNQDGSCTSNGAGVPACPRF